MLRTPSLQRWYAFDPSRVETLLDIAVMRVFVGINGQESVPDETRTVNVLRLLETHRLSAKMLEAISPHLQQKA